MSYHRTDIDMIDFYACFDALTRQLCSCSTQALGTLERLFGIMNSINTLLGPECQITSIPMVLTFFISLVGVKETL